MRSYNGSARIHTRVVGHLWMGGLASYEYEVSAPGEDLSTWTADDVQGWLDSHSGDFQELIGWEADRIEATTTEHDGYVENVTRCTPIRQFTEDEEEQYISTLGDWE